MARSLSPVTRSQEPPVRASGTSALTDSLPLSPATLPGMAVAVPVHGRLPACPTEASAQRVNLQAAGSEGMSVERVRIQRGDQFASDHRWHMRALVGARATVHDMLSHLRKSLCSSAESRVLEHAYKRWRNASPESPDYERLKAEGLTARAELGLLAGHDESLLARPLQGSPLERFISPFTNGFRDPQTGLVAQLERVLDGSGNQVMENGKPVLQLCIQGTGRGNAIRAQLKANIVQFLGLGVPPAHLQALELARVLEEKLGAQNELKLAGHSLGGGIASFAGAMLLAEKARNGESGAPGAHGKSGSFKVLAVNPAGLGGACMAHLRQHGADVDGAGGGIINVRVKKDQVSSDKAQRRLAAIARHFFAPLGLRIPTPRHLGKIYEVAFDDLPEGRNLLRAHKLEFVGSIFEPGSATAPAPRPV